MTVSGVVRHLLLDADGVLQSIPGGGQVARAAAYAVPADVLDAVFAAEGPALSGAADFRVVLAETLADHGIRVDADDFYEDLWHTIEVSPEMVRVVGRLREAGYGVHLGTNQHRERGQLMRGPLGYDELVEVGCYSWEMGVAKPDPAYFERALELIGSPGHEVLFIDDKADNVAAARSVGLRAERWELPEGVPALLRLFAGHGVELG